LKEQKSILESLERPHLRQVIPPIVDRVAMISVHTSPFAQLGGRDTGGMNVYVRDLSRNLADRGVKVDIFTRRTDRQSPAIADVLEGVRLINIEAGPPEPVDKDALFCSLPDFASEMAYLSQREGTTYDVIHGHYWLSGWAGKLLQNYWDAPLVMMFHTLAHLKNEVASNGARETMLRLQVESRLMDIADTIITANPDEQAELIARLGPNANRISLVPPGIDLNLFQPGDSAAARRALDLPTGPLVLFVGRIDPVKGIDTLFEGFHHLLRSQNWGGQPPRLVFVGGLIRIDGTGSTMDADLQRLARRAQELGLADSVLFRGSQPRQLLPLYYNAVDVCAVPSRYESFGLVAVEAMACGTPIVASSVGGLRFSIEDGVSGLLVPHSEPTALSDALYRVLSDHGLRSRMQVGARQAAIRYSWQTITSAMLRVYERVVTREPAAEPLQDYASVS
jgi:D-inositol-3-phosphate glycosyltransferase